MCDSRKTKKALIEELQTLRSRLAELERVEGEHKRAEEALRESEQRYARAEQIGHFGHFERDLVEDKATWSRESYRLFGVDPNRFEPSYENFLNLVHPSDREPLNNAMHAAISHGKPLDIEYRIVRPDGTERVLHSVAEVRFDKSGRPMKLVGTALDITERRQAEEVLRKARDELEARVQERTATLSRTNELLKEQVAERKQVQETLWLKNVAMESSINAFAFVDLEGNLTYVNDSFLKMWGYSDQKQVLGKDAVQFWVDVDRAAEIRKMVYDKGSWVGELVAKRKDGSTFDAHLSASLIRDEAGNPVCLMASFIDVTERKRAEEKIICAKEEWERTFMAVPDLIAIIDNDYRIVQVNKAMAERMGVAPDQAVGMICYECVHQTRQPPTFCPHSKLLADGQEYTEEIYEEHLGGHFIVSVSPLRDDDGSLTGCVHVARDITERKKVEEGLKQYRFMVESAHDAIFFKDLKSRYIIANKQTLEAFGLSREQVIGKNDLQIMPNKQEAKENIENDQLVFQTCEPKEITKHMTGADGKERCFQAIKVPQFDDKGNIVGLVGVGRDITELKWAEEALRQSENKYRTLLENLPQKIFLKDRNSVYVSCNVNYARDLKIKPPEIVGKTDYDFFPKELAEKYRADDKRLMEFGQPEDIEEKYIQDGQELIVHTVKTPVRDAQGNVIGILGIFWDITEHKRAEEALRESEERYRTLIENINLGITLIDTDHRIIMTNAGQGSLFNKPSSEFIGKYCFREFEKRDEVCSHCPGTRAMATGRPAEVEAEGVRDDGTRFPVRIHAFPVFETDGATKGFVEVVEDITEHKRAEEALGESEHRFRSLVETSSDWVWEVDRNGIYTYASPKVKDLLGYEPGETIGKTPFDLMPPDEAERVAGVFKDIVESRKPFDGLENTNLHKDGRLVVLETSGVPILGEGGNLLGYRGIDRDITERKKAQEALQRARDELENRVEQRTADLAKAIEELKKEIGERKKAEEKLRSLHSELSLAEERLRRRLATDVHDHIGQNLAISKIKLDSLRDSVHLPEVAESLDEISELVGQTIQSTRSLTFELSPPVLYELGFEAAVEWLVRQMRERHALSTEFKNDGRVKPLEHDVRVLLFQAVRELLVNVAKHANAHSVTVSTRRIADQIEVSVEDDGVGFDTSEVGSRAYKTGGFGLFSIRERLGLIGGHLDVESRPDTGTRVTLVAPIDHRNKTGKEKQK